MLLFLLVSAKEIILTKLHFRGFIGLCLSRIFPKKQQSLLHSHAHVSAMFLQTKQNQPTNILGDAQARSLSQISVRIKNAFQNMKGQV
jgi:hypothetical protein